MRLGERNYVAELCSEWTDAKLIAILTERYAPSTIPPCRVCGAELTLQSLGGGPTVWGCSHLEADPTDANQLRVKPGRRLADEHYKRSRFEDPRCDGDAAVLEALKRWQKK